MTVDGFGFGTLTGESCLKNVHCHTDRASWDAILVTVVAFGALMWKTCAQSHRFGLGRVGGGGYHWGGGRRTENRDHMIPVRNIYIYFCIPVFISKFVPINLLPYLHISISMRMSLFEPRLLYLYI